MRLWMTAFAGLIVLFIPAQAAVGDKVVDSLMQTLSVAPQPSPAADETSIEGDGNAETDALLNCYEQFSGTQPDTTKIGPPRLTRSPSAGFILRADFPKPGETKTVDRLTCWRGGFTTQKDLSTPPLYPPGTAKADPATQQAITGWQERRKAEALKRATAKRLPPADAETVSRLEGIWLIGRKPDKGPCIAQWYLETQIQFEFAKSGGRALIFEPYDLFTAISLSGVERTGDILEIQGQDRVGGLVPFMRLRLASADRIEILSPEGKTGPTQIAYRCGEPNRSVNETMSPESLAEFIPPVTLGGGLSPAVPGVSDTDVCQGKSGTQDRRFLQVEIYGPVHYWIFGMGFKPQHRLAFDFIRSVHQTNAHTIKLQMQEHLEKGAGWDVPESRGATYELTIIDRGTRLEIPELSTSFVKCKANAAANTGMHRW